MSKDDFVFGSTPIENFWKFINDRHEIYLKRKRGEPKPWSDDPIFLDWKFTNVFRELDRGTIAIRQVLHKLWVNYQRNLVVNKAVMEELYNIKEGEKIKEVATSKYIRNQFINCILYRMFNYHKHCEAIGPIYNPTALYKYLEACQESGHKVFGGAYMHAPGKSTNKLQDYIEVCRQIVSDADDLISIITTVNTLHDAWNVLQKYDCVGPFVAYEFVCDLRYTDILNNATDTCTWCNIGPGAERGLKRLGLKPTLESIVDLFHKSYGSLQNKALGVVGEGPHWIEEHWSGKYPYWELREIEHCLCELDKYERIRLGEGRPRAKFHGRPVESETSQWFNAIAGESRPVETNTLKEALNTLENLE